MVPLNTAIKALISHMLLLLQTTMSESCFIVIQLLYAH